MNNFELPVHETLCYDTVKVFCWNSTLDKIMDTNYSKHAKYWDWDAYDRSGEYNFGIK